MSPMSSTTSHASHAPRWTRVLAIVVAVLLALVLLLVLFPWDVLRGPVGSVAARRIIEKYQPVLAVHGHIHESGGERKIGKTLCINPGSEANHGILRGYIVDIGKKGIDLVQRVEG